MRLGKTPFAIFGCADRYLTILTVDDLTAGVAGAKTNMFVYYFLPPPSLQKCLRKTKTRYNKMELSVGFVGTSRPVTAGSC